MKTDYEFLKTEIDGHILTVTINRPDRMNALHPPAHAEFDEVWNEFDKDENLWVGIVTGEGDRAFSAGNDLKYQAFRRNRKKRSFRKVWCRRFRKKFAFFIIVRGFKKKRKKIILIELNWPL